MNVSVALAAYNGEKYIEKQIDSILSQLEANDELIIGYDESSDGTLGIVLKYASLDSRVRIIHNTNKGVVGNFNTALSNCSNDLVFISDQDDVWLSNKRNIVVDIASKTDCELIVHDGVHIDSEGNIISKSFFDMYGIDSNIIKNFIMPRYSGCCMALKRSALSYVLPLPNNIINYDHWIGMICEITSGIEFCNEILIHHRLHGGNITTSRRRFDVIAEQRMNLFAELLKRRWTKGN